MRINLILLAAGNSKRFNGNKLLAIYKDKPIYMHIVEKVLDLKVNKIICVTQYEEIKEALLNTNIRIPQMIDIDFDNERIVKEYIEGKTILELINEKEAINQYVFQVKAMQELCKNKGINIDYYPSNFVVDKNNNIFYIDYECNKYDPKWDYDNWGKQYWEKK